MQRTSRLQFITRLLAGVGIGALVAFACSDTNNDNRGVNEFEMMLAFCASGRGLPDGGSCDMMACIDGGSSMRDGGTCDMMDCQLGTTVRDGGSCEMADCLLNGFVRDGGVCDMLFCDMDAGVPLQDGGALLDGGRCPSMFDRPMACEDMLTSPETAFRAGKFCIRTTGHCLFADGGTFPGTVKFGCGETVFGIGALIGGETLFGLPHNAAPDASVPSLKITDFLLQGMIRGGRQPGSPTSLHLDPARDRLFVVSRATPRYFSWYPHEQFSPYEGTIGGGINTHVSRGLMADDNLHVYVGVGAGVGNPDRLFNMDLELGVPAYQLDVTDAGIVNPNWLTRIGPRRFVVGSASPTVNQLFVVNDTGTALEFDTAATATLSDGVNEGGRPGPCVVVGDAGFLMCASGNYSDGGFDAGNGGRLWKWTPGSPPVHVGTTPLAPSTMAISPSGDWLYLAEGNQFAPYYIGGLASNAPAPLLRFPVSTNVNQHVYDILPSPDGRLVYVSAPTSGPGRLYIFKADLTLVGVRTDLNRPGPLFFSPAR